MVIESKDEVFGWFKQLSGAYRIEVLTTLLHSCVPLEKRFFASVIETLARADYCALLDDEQKANTAADMESLCARDWLEDVVPHVPVHDAAQNGLVPVPKSLVVADAAVRVPPAGPADPVQAGDSAAVSFHAPPQPPPQQKPPLIPVRQQVVISMCLLNSTNRLCATILVKAIQKHLSVENLQRHLQIVIHGTDRGKEKPVLQTQVAAPDHQVVSEITLIFSLAFCHPAFTLEQQHLLSYQLKVVKDYLSSLGNTFSPAPSFYYQPHQYASVTVPFPAAQFQSYYPITDPVPEPKVKSCYNCGSAGHLGQECREETLDDLTRSSDFNLNFVPQPLPVPEPEPRNGPPAYTNHLKGRTVHAVHEQPASRTFATREEPDERGKSTHPSTSQRDTFHDRSLNQGDQAGS